MACQLQLGYLKWKATASSSAPISEEEQTIKKQMARFQRGHRKVPVEDMFLFRWFIKCIGCSTLFLNWEILSSHCANRALKCVSPEKKFDLEWNHQFDAARVANTAEYFPALCCERYFRSSDARDHHMHACYAEIRKRVPQDRRLDGVLSAEEQIVAKPHKIAKLTKPNSTVEFGGIVRPLSGATLHSAFMDWLRKERNDPFWEETAIPRVTQIIGDDAGKERAHWFYVLARYRPELDDAKNSVWDFARRIFYCGESKDIAKRADGHFFDSMHVLRQIEGVRNPAAASFTGCQAQLDVAKLATMRDGTGYTILPILLPSEHCTLSMEQLMCSVFHSAGLLNKERSPGGPIVWPLTEECYLVAATILRELAFMASTVSPPQQCLREDLRRLLSETP